MKLESEEPKEKIMKKSEESLRLMRYKQADQYTHYGSPRMKTERVVGDLFEEIMANPTPQFEEIYEL